MSMLRGLIKQVLAIAKQHNARHIISVRLKVGPLAHIEPDHLREHFHDAALGTIIEGAKLLIETTDELHDLTLESVELGSVADSASS